MKRLSKYFLVIFFIGTVLRLATLAKLLPFTPDEEYLIYSANTIIKDFHIIWIGVSSLGFDFYLGPFFIYFIVPFLIISKGDPIILGILASCFGLLTIWVLYWFGEKIFGTKVGLIASLIYALSPLIVFYDQKIYPAGVTFLSIGLGAAIYLSKYSKKWWIVFAILYGLVFHVHMSLALIIFVALYWAITHKSTLNKKTILLSILAFVITVSPLIAFDYFHKGSNITAPLRLILTTKKNLPEFAVEPRLSVFFHTLGRTFYLPSHTESSDEILTPCLKSKAPWFISAIILFLLVHFLLKKSTWQQDQNKFLVLMALAFILPLLFLSAINPVEYYLLGAFPFLLLIIAQEIESLKKPVKFLIYLLLIVFVINSIITIATANGSYGLRSKKNLIIKVMNTIGENPFELSEKGDCQTYGGWRYLFSAYGRIPERSSEDSNFAWLYPSEVSGKEIKYSVVINETRSAMNPGSNLYSVLQEGGFTGYIYTDEKSRLLQR